MLKQHSDGTVGDERMASAHGVLHCHAGPAGSPEERRSFLRLYLTSQVSMSLGNEKIVAACCELGLGGLFAVTAHRVEVGELVYVHGLQVSDDFLSLELPARVVRAGRDGLGVRREAPGIGICFVDFDAAGLARMKSVFAHCFARAAGTPGSEAMQAGVRPAIAELELLSATCCTLLGYADLATLWSASGPGRQARDLLATNGLSLPVSKRVLLLFAWRLWNGRCDLRATEFWHLQADAQEAVTHLLVAVEQGSAGVREWLARFASPFSYRFSGAFSPSDRTEETDS